MGLERVQRAPGGVDVHRFAAPPEDVVGERRQILHMIEVGVGDEDVVDLRLPVELEGAGERTRVDGQMPIDQEAGRAVTRGFAAMTAEDG